MTSITVVTPWLDAPELADDYLAAVNATLDYAAGDACYVIDNGSRPALNFARFWPEENLGFQRANNLGLERALTDAVLFLNNDIAHTRENWLEPIREASKPGRLVGAELCTGEHARIDGRLFPYLSGWCLAGMRDDLIELGGWDETLAEPAYYGDNLLCLKARRAGMKLVQVDVGLRHLQDYTSNRLDPDMKIAATMANRARFIEAARETMVVAA